MEDHKVLDVTPDNFLKQFAIRLYLIKAIYADGYSPPDSIIHKIVLTKQCHEFLTKYRDTLGAQLEADLTLGAFVATRSNEYWIDSAETDYDGILNILSSEIVNKRIRFPWIFGHELVDKYEKQTFKQDEELDIAETSSLLDDIPQGVFQIGKYVCGPLGILESAITRDLSNYPTKVVPIRYCPDPGCRHLHTVTLSSGRPKFLDIYKLILKKLDETDIDVVDLEEHFEKVTNSSNDYYSSLRPNDLPILLGNGFVLEEIRAIVALLIRDYGGEMRPRFPSDKRLTGHADEIALRLNGAELLQIALLATDENIITVIENKVNSRKINIPRGEVRASHFHRSRGGWLGMHTECSSDGVRFAPSQTTDRIYVAQIRLRQLILGVFPTEESRSAQLDYVLRGYVGLSLEERLEQFIAETPPQEIVSNVFLPVGSRVKEVERFLKFGVFPSPDGAGGDDDWVRRVCWKLGYNLPDVESIVADFDEHNKNFFDVIRRNNPIYAPCKEKIRQASISYFVAIEALLDLALSFTSWSLSSDHYGKTNFKYCSTWAKELEIELLTSAAIETNSDVKFESNGHWTLYPLIEGFRILSSYLALLEKSKKTEYVRSKSDLPGFFDKTTLAFFPFLHTFSFFDLSEDSKQKLLKHLEWISNSFRDANVAGLRNRLEHNRPSEDFPTQDELETMCELVSKIFKEMERSGSMPMPLSLFKRTTDQFGRTKLIVKDFRGRESEISWPHDLLRSMELDFDSPIVMFNDAVINGTSIPLRFNWIGASKYADYWKGRPNPH